jgi:hypothetical protein
VAGVGEQGGVDHVADTTLESPDGFLARFALGSFAVVVGPTRTAAVSDLSHGGQVDGVVEPPIPSP